MDPRPKAKVKKGSWMLVHRSVTGICHTVPPGFPLTMAKGDTDDPINMAQ